MLNAPSLRYAFRFGPHGQDELSAICRRKEILAEEWNESEGAKTDDKKDRDKNPS